MSLTEVARELGVSKPALYRHFGDKDALLDAMYAAFFDDQVAFIRDGFERALAAEAQDGINSVQKIWETSLIMMRTVSEYYVRNRDAFIFSLIRVYSRQKKEEVDEEFRKRGIDFRRLRYRKSESGVYPSKSQLSVTTLVFHIANFHRFELKPGEIPSQELVEKTVSRIEERVIKGLSLDLQRVAALDYERLEKLANETVYEDTEKNNLLKAVAEAVAEAGPWNVSMEMVARRSGLSKSGLYAHFINKQDMLGKLFISEFTRLINSAKTQIETSLVPEEQLYLAIISIADKLRSRPEFLMVLEWLKTSQLDLEKMALERLESIIASINLEAIKQHDQRLLLTIAQWLLLLIVSILIWRPSLSNNTQENPNESFRMLFRFIALGTGGLNK